MGSRCGWHSSSACGTNGSSRTSSRSRNRSPPMFAARCDCSIDYPSESMTPKDFTFKLTVPADPEGATIVAVMTGHAVEYTGIEGAAGAAFIERVRAVALKSLTGTAPRQG